MYPSVDPNHIVYVVLLMFLQEKWSSGERAAGGWSTQSSA
jgi:hypothetical protein